MKNQYKEKPITRPMEPVTKPSKENPTQLPLEKPITRPKEPLTNPSREKPTKIPK
jgi:hypothetical protein